MIQIGWDERSMVEDALAAYETEGIDRCYAVAGSDDEIDTLCQQASEQVVRNLIERSAPSVSEKSRVRAIELV